VPIVPLFDARNWIAGNLVGGTEVAPDTLGAYSNFLMMWHIFEMLVCDGAAHSKALLQASRRMTRARAEAVDLAKLDIFIRHFSGLLSPAHAAAICGDPVDADLSNSVLDIGAHSLSVLVALSGSRPYVRTRQLLAGGS
jgi:hypothetical protein